MEGRSGSSWVDRGLAVVACTHVWMVATAVFALGEGLQLAREDMRIVACAFELFLCLTPWGLCSTLLLHYPPNCSATS